MCAEGKDLYFSVPVWFRLARRIIADVLLQYTVEIAATESEGADARTTWVVDRGESGALVRIHIEW